MPGDETGVGADVGVDATPSDRPESAELSPGRIIERSKEVIDRSRELRERLAVLADRIPTVEEHAAGVVNAALGALGASSALAMRLAGTTDSGWLELHGSANVPASVASAFARIALSDDSPLAESIRSQQILAFDSREALLHRHPAMSEAAAALGLGAFCAAPLHHLGQLRGVLALVFPEPRTFSHADLAIVRTLGVRYARALYNARMYFAERAARANADAAWQAAERARAALEVTHEALERRVAERTAELERTNTRLAEEMGQRRIAEEERDRLRRQLAAAEEAERRRLSRELHDQLGQHLTAFSLGLSETRRLLEAGKSPDARLTRLEELAQDMTRDARRLALELRPPELDDVGLESALATYVEQWSARYGVSAELESGLAGSEAEPVKLPSDVGTAIYRIVQEALTNVARHANASQVSVLLDFRETEVRVVVEDDGTGFDVTATMASARRDRRLGLSGMRERAALVGGSLDVESERSQGTTLYVRVPLERREEGA